MFVLQGRNVNDLYLKGRELLDHYGRVEETRAGPCLVAPWPVVSKYAKPQERVLFDEQRDANPFFHFFECLWMLAGRDDATWLDRFVSNFSERFAEKSGRMHGAYGHRWRDWFLRELDTGDVKIFDQVKEVVRILQADPLSRQCVIQMWDVTHDLGAVVKDKPCNTHIYLRVRRANDHSDDRELDLTVLCRSNDIVFGAYGANAVHFSFLQEYIAAGLGVRIGQLYQFSNNFHGYLDVLASKSYPLPGDNPYAEQGYARPLPMVSDFSRFDEDLRLFMKDPMDRGSRYYNRWFRTVAAPMWETHDFWKRKQRGEARVVSDLIQAPDWKRAVQDWMNRRTK